ncbi:MAG: sugar ABC transporter permease [Ruminococcaceae bacterium]|nr:sugar ABC transporter permease [Oscillospiraceae bacterium]
MNQTNTKVAAQPAPKKRKGKSLERSKAKKGYFFVLPFILGFFLIYLPLIVESIQYSFSEMSINGKLGGMQLKNVGFDNYKYALFEDTEFVPVLISSLKELVFDVPAIVIFSLFIAIILNGKMVGRAAFRAIFFIPVIVSTGIIEAIDLQNGLAAGLSNGSTIDTGGGQTTSTGTEIISSLDVQRFFSSMQVGTELVTYVTSLVNNVYDIINRSGVQMLIFLAGLQSISPAIYESCFIEGASSWETFWKITFPMISPMILVNAIYTIIDAFVSETNTVMSYISSVYDGSIQHAVVRSTAMSWIYFVVVLLILLLVSALLSAYVFYQRKDA